VAARKIVSVSLNTEKYKYTGEDLLLDFEVTDANKEDVKFTYYLNDAETSFNAEGEYRVVYIVDTHNFVGTGEFSAWIVNKEIAVVTLNKTSYKYNEEGFVLDFSANVESSLIEFTYYKNQEVVTPKFVGKYVVQYSVNTETYEGSGTLEFEIVKKQIEIAVGNTEFVYDGQEVALEYANPVAANMTISFSQDGKGVSPINAGTYQYSITIVDDNYCGEKQGEITIARAGVEIDVEECQYIYDKTEKQLNISVENDLQYTLEICQGELNIQSVVDAGTYAYTITVDLPNYYSVKTGSFVVEKRNIKVTATSYTITYGDIMPELAYTIENDIKADGLTFEFEPVELKNEVSETTIKIKQKALDNYEVQYVDGIYKVNPKTLKVTILAGNHKTYGEADPKLNFEIDKSDVVGEDVIDIVVSREEGELVGTYAIETASTTNKNYTLEVVGSVFKIIKRKIVVKADSLTAVYGEDEKQLTYTITYGNLVFGDELEGNLEREQGKNVGEFQISIGTLDNENYEILFLSGKYNITPKPLKVVATSVSSVYGESDAELIYTTDGLEPNDALEGKLKREEGRGVGEYEILIGTLANSNYKIEFTPAIYEITKRTLNITAHNKTSVYGDEFVELTYDVDNFAYGDDFDFELVKQQGEQVGTYDITLKNIVLDNYDINFTKGIYTITKKQISLKVVAGQSKVYGEDDEVLLYAIDGVVGTLEGIAIERASGEDAGFYDITLSYTDLANYEISECINGIFEIKKANVTITLNSSQFVYSGEAFGLQIAEEWPVSYVYKQNGIEVESAINAGEYSVVAKFDGDKNHNAATSNMAVLTITKKQIVISVENEFFMYDGKSKLPEYKTNVNCSCLVDLYKKSNSEKVESAIMPGEYIYKIIVNNDNYCGEVSGTMVIAEKQIVVDGDGNEIVDTNGDLATNGVVVELVKIDNRDTINGINRNLTKKSTQSAYTFSVVGELPKNSVVNIKLNAKDLEDISKYTLYFYNENYELKEVAYKIQDGVFVFDVSDINLGIVLAKINEGLDILLLVAAALVVTIIVITASTAIKIYKFVRVKSVVNQAGIEEEIPFARKTKNKKVYKILKKLDDKDLKKHKKRKKLMLEE
ncbi:MAG: hypothetical protein IJA69_02940, partial [Clostridia bacterium]|nr:hypothetical protein [Clostridia bacterium]